MRIAYARIAQETHAFSPLPSTFDDFQRNHVLEGDALGKACQPLGTEVPGWTRWAELSGFVAACLRANLGATQAERIESVPLLSYWAVPSGPLTEQTFLDLRDRLTNAIQNAGPLDGLFLSLHGAMRAQGQQPEPEDGFLRAARDILGPNIPIAVTYDLHAQMTRDKVNIPDILAVYQTNPHRDLFGAGYKAGKNLIRTLRKQTTPTKAWRALPMVLGGGNTVDILSPMRAIFRRIKAMERQEKVLNVGLFMCHMWNDSPDLGWSVVITTDNDPTLASQLADELAELAWSVRDQMPPAFVSPQEAFAGVRAAKLRRKFGTCCLCDASDVVGSGSTGEGTKLLGALLHDATDLKTYATVRDALFIQRFWDTPQDTWIESDLGGRLDPTMNPPLPIRGRITKRLHTTQYGRALTLDLDHLKVVVTELAPYTLKPSFYGAMGLDPWRADAVMVKSFFHFRIYYALVNRLSYLVKTEGLTDIDMVKRVAFHDPTHPFSQTPVEDWRAADRRRRGVAPPLPQPSL